jgi:PAS domain S-box-containing protein
VTAALPLTLTHSWPIYEAEDRLPLKSEPAGAANGLIVPVIGLWTCTLHDNALLWTQPVYDLFGIPMDEPLTRSLTVSLYVDESRAAMEELRAYAIRHRRGFTLDAQIRRPNGDMRWMRLSALPILEGKKVVRLTGTKQDVTHEYDGPD